MKEYNKQTRTCRLRYSWSSLGRNVHMRANEKNSRFEYRILLNLALRSSQTEISYLMRVIVKVSGQKGSFQPQGYHAGTAVEKIPNVDDDIYSG